MSRKPYAAARRFAAATGGNIAIWAAVSVLPLGLAVGAATDLRRLENARSLVQDAADAAVLAAGRTYSAEVGARTGSRRKAAEDAARRAMEANLAGRAGDVTGLGWDLKIGEDGREFAMVSRARVPLAFGGLFGMKDVPLRVTSTASMGVKRVELALVLDNTGSMAGEKIKTLKSSAAMLVDRLATLADGGPDPQAMKIALVPFSMTVRLPAALRTADWVDRGARSSAHGELFAQPANRFALLDKMGAHWEGCVESRPYPHDVRETEPASGDPDTLFVPYFAPDEPGDGTTTSPYGNDYLADSNPAGTPAERQQELVKYEDGKPRRGTNGWGYAYGPNAGCSLTPITPLTTDEGRVETAINSMVAVGDTNIPLGLAWGWHALSPRGPLKSGVAYGTRDTIKIAVLMTDGQNNVTPVGNHNGSIYSGVGYITQGRLGAGIDAASSRDERRTAMDARLAELCRNMKAEGIVIYTVRVEVKSGPSDVLRNCATTPEGFFDVQDVKDLSKAFNTIADSITGLRLSR